MFRTRAAAEEAAMTGRGREWDSQDCRAFQDEVLSSSPRDADDAPLATKIVDINQSNNQPLLPPTWVSQHSPVDAHNNARLGDSGASDQKFAEPIDPSTDVGQSLVHSHAEGRDGFEGGLKKPVIKPPSQSRGKTRTLSRNSEGKLRLFDTDGTEVALVRGLRPARKGAMEEHDVTGTQKSSMSLTQENPESAYERYKTRPLQDEADRQHTLTSHPPSKSLNAESTTHTYGEDDTGHINLQLPPDYLSPNGDVQDDSDDSTEDMPNPSIEQQPSLKLTLDEASQDILPSQDPIIFSLRAPGFPVHEPQTPAAAPINPFINKGSVMKGHELFGATQPSSIGKAFNQSPTSSRPSPDVFNQFATPKLPSSPLQTRDHHHTILSPIPSSPALVQTSASSLGPRSELDSRAQGVVQPRVYRSVRESQERRRRVNRELESDSDSDGSTSSIEASVRKRSVHKDIQRQISAVGLRRVSSTPSKRVESSDQSVDRPTVEVPSTSTRRRSLEDDYLAQCSGHDARDTQNNALSPLGQTEVVADSQTLPDPHLVPSNHSHPRSLRSASPQDVTVPETSPYIGTGHIRPMADIASFSYSAEEEHLNIEDLAGFTQDEEFDRAVGRPTIPFSTEVKETVNPLTQSSPIRQAKQSQAANMAKSLIGTTKSPSLSPHNKDAGRKLELRSDPRTLVTRIESVVVERLSADDHPSETDDASETDDGEDVSPSLKTTKVNADAQVNSPSIDHLTDASYPARSGKGTAFLSNCVALQPSSEKQGITSSQPNKLSLNGEVDLQRPQSHAPHTDAAESNKLEGVQVPVLHTESPPSTHPTSTSSSALSSVQGFDSAFELTPSPALPALKNDDPVTTSTPSSTALSGTSNTSKKPRSKRTLNAAANRTLRSKQSGNLDAPRTRNSKRKAIQSYRESSSDDPLALSMDAVDQPLNRASGSLFQGMAFAVSYVSSHGGKEKEKVVKLIIDNGGEILETGFDSLFDRKVTSLEMLNAAQPPGFTALIADSHSRRAKYIQALALGLPCLSGLWVTTCVTKNSILDWSPYLLCAGQSTLLNACRSRMIQPYDASVARFADVIQKRNKFFEAKSVIIVMGKGRQAETRQAYLFIAKILGPARMVQVVDLPAARKLLSESKSGDEWDFVYVDKDEKAAATALFSPVPIPPTSRKRKTRHSETPDAPSKRIRVISDEVVVQSLIFGQFLDE